MKRGFVIAVLVLAGCNIPGLDDPTAGGSSSTSSGSGIATFDGTYSYSYQIDNNGTEQSNSNVAQLLISNGVISSNPAGFAGSVTDSTGNVSFTGPCPISGNTGGATYIGTVVNDTPKFGQGTWTCTTGGVSDNWQVNGGD
ncbi:MAG TPA: hypothetical protein VK733_06495 [Gemmatimonadaceae bacterium]|nr:hypothetical protein [Gemmatimonadaceae bacterium]